MWHNGGKTGRGAVLLCLNSIKVYRQAGNLNTAWKASTGGHSSAWSEHLAMKLSEGWTEETNIKGHISYEFMYLKCPV